MPRRISDYPDMYAGWNFICTVGAYLTFFALFIYFFLMILLLLNYTNIYLFKSFFLLFQDNKGKLSFFNIKSFYYFYKNFVNDQFSKEKFLNFMTADIRFIYYNILKYILLKYILKTNLISFTILNYISKENFVVKKNT